MLPVNEQIAEVIRTHNKQLKPKEALEAAGDMLEPVSYTHLDVYKRQ